MLVGGDGRRWRGRTEGIKGDDYVDGDDDYDDFDDFDDYDHVFYI